MRRGYEVIWFYSGRRVLACDTTNEYITRSTVHRSATFEGSPPAQNKLHRSETVPAATVASSLASLGSSFKIGFSRYTPSRLSLRKADLKVSQQFIENALTTLSIYKSSSIFNVLFATLTSYLPSEGARRCCRRTTKNCMDSLTQLAEHNSITLKWMRGHQGHEGNERADFLAKKGAEVPLIGPEPTCGLAYRTARKVIKDLLREKLIALGESPRVETFADVHWRTILGQLNRLHKWIVGLFTGHCPLMRHHTTIGGENDPDCRRCGEEEETSFHILCECPALAAIRYSILGAITIEPKEVTDAPLETVLKFLKETGLME
ncbi:hypothetical protein NQ318_011345 [Aromia moschata]|uniref:RNase H type-1 domain-containing protein n=1 Tax=Aromia moschata TaxID=1265417 RepID=A0AAV8XFW6_9CUCU|nr:hypothetical protein NQ318_011345 [Aromia moschata]